MSDKLGTDVLNVADRLAVSLAVLGVPLSDDEYLTLSDCTAVGQAALLLAADESAIEAWYDAADRPTSPIARVLSRAVDREEVADRIDAALATEPLILADLRRAELAWTHEDMPRLLDEPEFRVAAAWALSMSNVDALIEWLDGERTPQDVVDVARAVAQCGSVELFDALEPWLGAIREEEAAPSTTGACIEAALFVLSPDRWGRGYLRGRWDASFLTDPEAMADILTSSGPSYWSDALAAFDPDSEEFDAIARMVVASAAAQIHFLGNDPPEFVSDAFWNGDWAGLSTHPAFAIAVLLADEADGDEGRDQLIEAAGHDLMRVTTGETPGLIGLPLSSSDPDEVDVEEARKLAALREAEPLALVATMSDIAELKSLEDYRDLPNAFRDLQSSSHPVVATVAKSLFTEGSVIDDIALATRTDVRGLAAAERLARRDTIESLTALIELLASGPITRSTLYSGLIFQGLSSLAVPSIVR